MNRSDSRDSAGQSADDVLKTSKHHDLRTRIAAAVIPEIPLLMLVVGAVVIWWRS